MTTAERIAIQIVARANNKKTDKNIKTLKTYFSKNVQSTKKIYL